jgi:hypothetical protein
MSTVNTNDGIRSSHREDKFRTPGRLHHVSANKYGVTELQVLVAGFYLVITDSFVPLQLQDVFSLAASANFAARAKR